MTGESDQRLIAPDVPDVDSVVFTAAGNKALVDASKARVDRVISLRDTLEDPDQALVAQIPQVETLCRHIQQSQAVGRVHCERHNRIVLLDHVEVVSRLEAVIANSIMRISTEDGLIVAEECESIDPYTVPII